MVSYTTYALCRVEIEASLWFCKVKIASSKLIKWFLNYWEIIFCEGASDACTNPPHRIANLFYILLPWIVFFFLFWFLFHQISSRHSWNEEVWHKMTRYSFLATNFQYGAEKNRISFLATKILDPVSLCRSTGQPLRGRATPILSLCHGVFTDQFIFTHILGHSFPRNIMITIRLLKGKKYHC